MIDIIDIIDNDDGSATITIDMSKDDVQLLLNHAINDILKKYVEKPKS